VEDVYGKTFGVPSRTWIGMIIVSGPSKEAHPT
jgi:hypothetical protein